MDQEGLTMDLKKLDQTYVAPTYKRFPVEIVSGKGSIVYDANGKSYIDLTSGIGVTSFGVADDEWQNAVRETSWSCARTHAEWTSSSASIASWSMRPAQVRAR